jgi:hypothetical protein
MENESRKKEYFDCLTRWGEWTFSIYLIPPAEVGSGVCSASNRNDYQKQKINVSGE